MTVLALALSSSTGVMSAAIGPVGDHEPLAATTLTTDRRHAEEISPLVQKLMADGGIELGDLGCLIVDRGPGRFTGLRVGLATVKTLAFALGIPVVGLTSLEILAAVAMTVSRDDGTSMLADSGPVAVTAVIDARRNEVFQQRFGFDGTPVGEPQVGAASVLAGEATGLVVGDGLDRYRSAYEEAAGSETRLASGINVDGAVMLAAAAGRVAQPGAAIEPLYLRDPDVNPNVKTRPRV